MMTKRFLWISFLFPFFALGQGDYYDWHIWSEATVEYKELPKLDLGIGFQNRLDQNITRLRGNYLTLEASYKLGMGIRLVVGLRGATSPRWDQLRMSGGFSRGFNVGKNTSIKCRFLFQHQVFSGSDARYGLNLPQQNYRLRLSFRQKLIKKTWFILHTEPMWRGVPSEIYFLRIRSSAQIERSLPGPWSVNAGYMLQVGFNGAANFHAGLLGVTYELSFKPKTKNLQ
jgi:hypothetical protein